MDLKDKTILLQESIEHHHISYCLLDLKTNERYPWCNEISQVIKYIPTDSNALEYYKTAKRIYKESELSIYIFDSVEELRDYFIEEFI